MILRICSCAEQYIGIVIYSVAVVIYFAEDGFYIKVLSGISSFG